MNKLPESQYAALMNVIRGDGARGSLYDMAMANLRFGLRRLPPGGGPLPTIPMNATEWQRDPVWSKALVDAHQEASDIAWAKYWRAFASRVPAK